MKRVCACFVDFDEIGAFLDLFANYGDEFGGTIGVSGVRENVLLGVVADGVFVAAENGNRVTAYTQTWAGDQSLVDGIADGGIG